MTAPSPPPAPRRTRCRLPAAALAVVAALVLAACGAAYDAPRAIELPPEVTVSTLPAVATRECRNDDPSLPAITSYTPDAAVTPPGQFLTGSFMDRIRQAGRLKVGTSIDTQLFSAVNPETNRIEGFDVDMTKLVALAIFGGSWADIDAKLDLRGITYAQRIPKVSSGEVDIVAHTMTINCARWQQVAFSGVYLYAGQRLLVAKGSEVTDIAELAGKTVCVSAGGTSADEMRNLDVDPPIEVIEVDNQTDCVVKFQQGEADAIRSDDTVLAGFAAQDPYAVLAGPLLTEEPYGMAMSLEHPEFVSFVNAVLEQAKANPNPYPAPGDVNAPAPGWQAIYDHWLRPYTGQPVERLTSNPDRSVSATYGAVPFAPYGRPAQ